MNPSVDYDKWLKSLDTELNEPTNQNLIKVPKVVRVNENAMIKQCNKQPNVPFLLE